MRKNRSNNMNTPQEEDEPNAAPGKNTKKK